MTDQALRTAILGALANAKAEAPSRVVRETDLRNRCGVAPSDTPDQFARSLEALIPSRIVRSSPSDPDFDLTPMGWLESPRRADVDRVVEAILAALKCAVLVDGRVTLKGADLQAQGLSESDLGLILCVARTFYLASQAHGAKHLEGLSLPQPLDVIELRDLGNAGDFYRYRAQAPKAFIDYRERLKNSVDAITRSLIDEVWRTFNSSGEWAKINRLELRYLDEREEFQRAIRSEFFHGGDHSGANVRLSLSLSGMTQLSDAEARQELILRVADALYIIYEADPDQQAIDESQLAALVEMSPDDVAWAHRFLRGNPHMMAYENGDRNAFRITPQILAARNCESLAHLAFRFGEQDRRDRDRSRNRSRRSAVPGLRLPGLGFGFGGVGIEEDPSEEVEGVEVTSRDSEPSIVDVTLRLGRRPAVIKFLGSGAEADVYLVNDRFGREVAAKVFYQSNRVPKHIYAHAAGLARVPHPAVAQLYTIDEVVLTDGTTAPAILMERLVGEELDDRLRREISVRELVSWGRTLLDVFAAMHSIDHFHQDPHPGNFFVTDSGLRLYDVLRRMSVENRSTAGKETLRSDDARRVRGLIEAMLDKLPRSEASIAASTGFARATRNADLTLGQVRAAFSDAVELLQA